jgi:hypothetical protein
VILTTALLLSFFLMTLQVRHESSVVTFTRQVVLFTVSPFLKVTTALVRGTRNVWRDYVDLRVPFRSRASSTDARARSASRSRVDQSWVSSRLRPWRASRAVVASARGMTPAIMLARRSGLL